MSTLIQPDIHLERHRCFDCGRYYMVENQRRSRCPICAAERIEKLLEELAALERSNSALRGVIARKRGKR